MQRRINTTLASIAVLICAGFLLAPTVQAQGKCNLETIKGSYGYLNTGTFAGTPLASVGSMTFDGLGNISGNDTNSFGGAISSSPFTGTYTVNGNCTGTLTVSFGFFAINNNMAIVDNGKEIFVIETNPGSVATGVFKRQ